MKINSHQAFSKETNSTSTIVLYIHGIMGSPLEFQNFAPSVEKQNINYKAILLPGHGSSGVNFIKNNAPTWQVYVNNEVECLSKQYEKILLIGHSLGGLLALNASIQYPIAGIVLINTPIKTRITMKQISLSFRVLFASKNNKDPLIQTYKDSFSIGMQDWWSIPGWSIRLGDIIRVASTTEKILDKVNTSVYIFQSVQDETVNPISAKILQNKLINSKVNTTYLTNSTHAYFEEKDRRQIVRGITQLIKNTEIESLKVVIK